MRKRPARITKCITFDPALLGMIDSVCTALALPRSVMIDMACMHYIDYLGTGRQRSTPALFNQRLKQRGLDIELKKRRGRIGKVTTARIIKGRIQDKSTQLQDTNTLTCESTVIDSIDPDFQANNDGSKPGDCQPDTGPDDASLCKDALSQSDGEANQA